MKRHRELQVSQRKMAKQTAKDRDAHEAEQFQNYLDLLVSLHTDCGDHWDWAAHAAATPPDAPQLSCRNESVASEALRSYVPGFFEKLFGGAKARALTLTTAVSDARASDQAEYQQAFERYRNEFDLWAARRALAARILAADPSAYPEALTYASAFEEIAAFRMKTSISAIEHDVVAVACQISSEEVVPTEEVKLTAAGKLVIKVMPVSRYWGIYQDYVCSSAIRVAQEIFAALPIGRAIVNVGVVQTNASTGHPELATVLAVHFARETLQELNLLNVDPSASMKNFPHRMKFKKTTGFEPVAAITTQEQWISS